MNSIEGKSYIYRTQYTPHGTPMGVKRSKNRSNFMCLIDYELKGDVT